MTDPVLVPQPAEAHTQAAYAVRLEWGPTGAAAVATIAAGTDDPSAGSGRRIAVVVDVLSFTTTLSVAVERGMTVFPYRWKDDGAAAYAAERDAVLAVGRLEARSGQGGVSLSPASLLAVEGVERVVLPSPNGSAISFALADSGCTVVGACLRNASAVAAWLAPQVATGAVVAVVAAGERWPDGSLRPAVEDVWGAGAVLAALSGHLSPEATFAADAFRAVRPILKDSVLTCASGRELADHGFIGDVRIAAEHDVSDVVPVLQGEAFGPAVGPAVG